MDARRGDSPGFWLAGRFTPRQVDWMVVGAALILSAPPFLRGPPAGTRPAVALTLLPLATVPLLWRRTRPGTTLAVLAAAFTISAAFGSRDANGAGLLFGVFAAALYGDRRTRTVAGAVAVLVLAAGFGLILATGNAKNLGHLGGPALGFGVAWVLGDRTRTRRAYLAELEERAARLEREQEESALRAAEEERIRIARELHDVVAHNVSVIAVQAGASRIASAESPNDLVDTMGLIERTARATLAELRTLLGVLRREDRSPPSRTPRPTMARLDDLVAQARESGNPVDARIEGDVRELPPVVDLSAYRIVQEALTNVRKHAPGASVRLSVRYGDRDLEIVIEDDGPGRSPGGAEGHGLIGMRERAALVGGKLLAGPASGGGFRVEVRLPLVGDTAAEQSLLLPAEPADPANS